MARLSVILVTYRSRATIESCLASLPAAAGAVPHEILVVDNASGDGLAAELRRTHPEVRVFESGANVGFARGVNRGLAEATGDVLCFLNPDCVAAPGALEALARFVAANRDIGAAGPKILDPNGELQLSCRRFPTHWTGLFNRYSILTRLFPQNPWSREYLMLDFDHASAKDVDWLSGACLVTRRDVVDKVGGLDEAFFLFNEDVDWCRRVHAAGFRVVYQPAAVVTHAIGASKGALPVWLLWRRHMGMRHYFRKHHPSSWPVRTLTELGILVRFAIQVLLNPFRGRTPLA